jgi:hypothetical protein
MLTNGNSVQVVVVREVLQVGSSALTEEPKKMANGHVLIILV